MQEEPNQVCTTEDLWKEYTLERDREDELREIDLELKRVVEKEISKNEVLKKIHMGQASLAANHYLTKKDIKDIQGLFTEEDVKVVNDYVATNVAHESDVKKVVAAVGTDILLVTLLGNLGTAIAAYVLTKAMKGAVGDEIEGAIKKAKGTLKEKITREGGKLLKQSKWNNYYIRETIWKDVCKNFEKKDFEFGLLFGGRHRISKRDKIVRSGDEGEKTHVTSINGFLPLDEIEKKAGTPLSEFVRLFRECSSIEDVAAACESLREILDYVFSEMPQEEFLRHAKLGPEYGKSFRKVLRSKKKVAMGGKPFQRFLKSSFVGIYIRSDRIHNDDLHDVINRLQVLSHTQTRTKLFTQQMRMDSCYWLLMGSLLSACRNYSKRMNWFIDKTLISIDPICVGFGPTNRFGASGRKKGAGNRISTVCIKLSDEKSAEVNGVKSYKPVRILYNPSIKEVSWDSVRRAMKRMGNWSKSL